MTKEFTSRIEEARERKATLNCAQSVACTYCDLAGISEEDATRICSGMGLGMGTMEGTCGALLGAAVVLGGAIGDRNKSRIAVAQLMKEFGERNGATICGQLKGKGTGKVLRACPDCVADAAEFLESLLPTEEL